MNKVTKEKEYIVAVKKGKIKEIFGFPTKKDQKAFCDECTKAGYEWATSEVFKLKEDIK